MSTSRLLVVVGSGPGVGSTTASLFASKGFNIALISRNAERLKEDVTKVYNANRKIECNTFAADVADSGALRKTLNQIHETMGAPEVVLFNTARIAPTTIGETDPSEVAQDFQLMNIGQIITATWALPLLAEVAKRPGTHPTFLNSSSGIGDEPIPQVFSLSMNKAAQNNFLKSLAHLAGPQGIHVARVDINGVVSDEKPELNAKNIADQHWKLSQQEEKDWEAMIDVGSFS